jgi:putative SOS response-associated peptidase YedK
MCYYNGQRVTRAEKIRLMQLEKLVADFDFLNSPLQEGFDFGPNAVLKPISGKEDYDIVKMEWGFLPTYLQNREAVQRFRIGYKDENGKWITGYDTLNAKAENLFMNEKGKPSMYRFAAKERRCLVLSSGFYEWRQIFPKNKRTGLPLKTPVKYPYRIFLPDEEYFFMAGIWNPWTDKDTGEHVDTFAITTTTATGNILMEQVHNSKKRMPTILNEELAYEWMFGKLSDERIIEIAKSQYPWQKMQAYSIAKDFKAALDPTEAFSYSEQDLPPLVLPIAA